MRSTISSLVCAISLFACQRNATRDDFCASDAITLSAAVSMYHLNVGTIPSTSQGLKALSERPEDLDASAKWSKVMDRLPLDPWGNRFDYVPDLNASPQTFVIISRGQDGKPSNDDREFRFSIKFTQQAGEGDGEKPPN